MMDNNQKFTIGDDYYVQDVKVNYKPSAMYATLSIYSLDKLYEKKLKEIEKAHNKWLAENNERNMIRQEEEAARNEEAVRSMRLDADE